MNSHNHMKRQAYAIFVGKSFKINMLITKGILKLEIINFKQVNTEVLQIAYAI